MNERKGEMSGNYGCDAWVDPSVHLGNLPVSDVVRCWWGDGCSWWASQEVGGRPRDISTPCPFGMLSSPAFLPIKVNELQRQSTIYWGRECRMRACASWPGVLPSSKTSGKRAQDKSRYSYTSQDYWLTGTEILNLIDDIQVVLWFSAEQSFNAMGKFWVRI